MKNTSGAVVWRWASDAFGNGLADSNPSGLFQFEFNLRFPGQQADAETGLYYNNARYYDPATGRYISSDPIGLAGGINTYGYVSQAPTGAVDPTGNFWVAGAVVGAVAGAGIRAMVAVKNGESFTSGRTWAHLGVAALGGAASGFTGAWVATVSSSVGTAFVLNGVIGAGTGIAGAMADNVIDCKPYETGIERAALLGTIGGAIGGGLGQGFTNHGIRAQARENAQRALGVATGYLAPSRAIAPSYAGIGSAVGNAAGWVGPLDALAWKER